MPPGNPANIRSRGIYRRYKITGCPQFVVCPSLAWTVGLLYSLLVVSTYPSRPKL